MLPELDTNIIIRIITGEPTAQVKRIHTFLKRTEAKSLFLPDLIFAECIYVLNSFYNFSPKETATLMEKVIRSREIKVANHELLLKTLTIFAEGKIEFPDAYLIARAEENGNRIVSFDKKIAKLYNAAQITP